MGSGTDIVSGGDGSRDRAEPDWGARLGGPGIDRSQFGKFPSEAARESEAWRLAVKALLRSVHFRYAEKVIGRRQE